MINEDFDYPTIGDFFEERKNCVCNLIDEGDSSGEIQKQFIKEQKLNEVREVESVYNRKLKKNQ